MAAGSSEWGDGSFILGVLLGGLVMGVLCATAAVCAKTSFWTSLHTFVFSHGAPSTLARSVGTIPVASAPSSVDGGSGNTCPAHVRAAFCAVADLQHNPSSETDPATRPAPPGPPSAPSGVGATKDAAGASTLPSPSTSSSVGSGSGNMRPARVHATVCAVTDLQNYPSSETDTATLSASPYPPSYLPLGADVIKDGGHGGFDSDNPISLSSLLASLKVAAATASAGMTRLAPRGALAILLADATDDYGHDPEGDAASFPGNGAGCGAVGGWGAESFG